MAQPKLFIGSSQKTLRVATLLAEGLEECTDATIWHEGVFGLNQGFLETLLKSLEEYDFAAFVLSPDDVTTSKDETSPSPRDNVLFESGLFMGALGRSRVFLVYDETVDLKLPSDLAGINLATYDGSRIEGLDASAAIRKACRLIRDKITASRFPNLVGEWRSQYPMTAEEGNPMVTEDVEIKPCRDGFSITSVNNPQDDGYKAFGREMIERQLSGRWESVAESTNTRGLFVLTVHPSSKYMYGYFTSPDMTGGLTYASWVLAKKAGADEAKISQRLKQAQDMLARITIGL
ncbi:MAG TPA: nucleotide-binding protein [Thermoanaerobaculia bacterium]|nr:nucleotide-binding protein [Thermoanaerobaculia bacterium]